jgi:hypothetical protein
MTLDFTKAHQLCTERELALVNSARSEALSTLTPKRVNSKITLARGLRDKFRDLADRQAREARRKAPPRGARPARGNARTVEKAALFDEVLKRFQGRAAELDQREVPEPVSRAKRVATKGGVTAGRRPSIARPRRAKSVPAPRPNRQQRGRSEAAAARRKQLKMATSHRPRVQAHASSRNRRGQARRDAR